MEEERFPPPPSAREPPRPPTSGLILDRFRALARDNDEIVQVYEELLAELTFNSKPIITELTIIAGEQREHGEGIADAICARILEVPVDQKLPSLYLLDSIVKNISREYVRYFAARLPKVFCEAYNQVHTDMHPAMRHLFGTWSQVFPSTVLRKIEDELQFSTSESQRSTSQANMRNSESPSPRHGIHVNPKYLEARRQLQRSAVMGLIDTQKNVQTADFEDDGMDRLASDSPKGWSGASPKFHDIEHASGDSSRLRGYGHHSSSQYADYDFTNPEMLQPHIGSAKAGSPKTAAVRTSIIGVEEPIHHLNVKVLKPLSPSRARLRRSASPIDDSFPRDGSPWRPAEMPSQPHSRLGFPPDRAFDQHQNGWLGRSWPPDVGALQREASTTYDPSVGYTKKHPRELIDAYGNYRGKSSSREKAPKLQRINVNVFNREAAPKNWRSFEEEEYAWEDMSPTLADRGRRSSLPPLGPSFESLSRRIGLSRPDANILEPDLRGNNWYGQTKQHPVGDPAKIIDDRKSLLGVWFFTFSLVYLRCTIFIIDERLLFNNIFKHGSSLSFQDLVVIMDTTSCALFIGNDVDSTFADTGNPVCQSGHRSVHMKSTDGKGVQNEHFHHYHNSFHVQEPGKFPYNFQHASVELSSMSRGWGPQMPVPVSGITAANGQKLHRAYDDSLDVEVPYHRLSSDNSGSLNVETSMLEKHLELRPFSPPAAILWPSAHKSQPLPILPVPPPKKQFKSPFTLTKSNKPVNQGPNSSMFLPHQQVDRKTSILGMLLPLPHQQAGLMQSQEQGDDMRTQTQEADGGYIPSLPANVFPHLLAPPQNQMQMQGEGVAMGSLPNKISAVASSGAMPSMPDTSAPIHGGIMPPLPPGPPPESSHMGPASQNARSIMSASPVSAFSGLISSLMAQGLISLTPPAQPEDSVGLEFNAELLKVRHESAINALYTNLQRQCTTCGLRFKCQEEHSSHMDWHVTKNRISKIRKQKPSRKWFVNTKEWLSGAETVGTDVIPFLPKETVTEKKEDKEMAVPADENQTLCALCGEPFEDFYSDEDEEWMYKGAVYLNASDGSINGPDRSQLGPIVHAKCRSHSNEGS